MIPPGPERVAELWLLLAETSLASAARDGATVPADLRWLVEAAAIAVPHRAVRLRRVCAILGPEVLAAVSRLASVPPGSELDTPEASGAPSAMGARDVARLLGITDRAVRMAAASGALAASRHPVTGAWLIERASAIEYGRRRGRALLGAGRASG